MVDGESSQGGATRERPHIQAVRAAVSARRGRRMDERGAIAAFLQTQLAIGTRGPEELVVDRDQRQRTSSQRVNPHSASFASVLRLSAASSAPTDLSCGSASRCSPHSVIACTGQSSSARITAPRSPSATSPLPSSDAYPQSSREKYSGACLAHTPKPSHTVRSRRILKPGSPPLPGRGGPP